MTWLTLQLLLGGGRARSLLVTGCTAVVTTLLLLAVTILLLPERAEEALYTVVADSGTRYGFVLAVALLVLPPLLLLHQAVRFGTAAREQRLAGLRLAGATPGDVRRISTLEVALPALAGGALGVLGFWVLRVLLGGDTGAYSATQEAEQLAACRELNQGDCYLGPLRAGLGQLVPRSVTLPWWAFVLVALGVALVGAVVGARVGRRVAVSPHGVTRRRREEPPRPWGLLALAAAAVGVPPAVVLYDRAAGLSIMVPIVVAVLGVVSLGPWVAHRAGVRALRRADDTAALLAAGRLAADPRPAGRAAAAVGGLGLAGGGATSFLVDLLSAGQAEAYYLVPLAMVAGCLLVGLVITCGTVAVHAVESLGDRRRSVAAQVAQGVPVEVIEASLRWEARLVAVPLGVGGAVLGAFALVALQGSDGEGLLAVLATTLLTASLAAALLVVLTLLAVRITSRLLRPAVVAATRPEHLRTA